MNPPPPPPPPGIINRDISYMLENADSSKVIGVYATPYYGIGGSRIALFNDDRYEYASGGCTASSLDSGSYTLTGDRIYFQSDFTQSQIDSQQNNSHGQLTRIEQASFNVSVIKLGGSNSKLKLYRMGMTHFETSKLNKNGNGEGFKLNPDGRKMEEGIYKNYKLFKGEIYSYVKESAVPNIQKVDNFERLDENSAE